MKKKINKASEKCGTVDKEECARDNIRAIRSLLESPKGIDSAVCKTDNHLTMNNIHGIPNTVRIKRRVTSKNQGNVDTIPHYSLPTVLNNSTKTCKEALNRTQESFDSNTMTSNKSVERKELCNDTSENSSRKSSSTSSSSSFTSSSSSSLQEMERLEFAETLPTINTTTNNTEESNDEDDDRCNVALPTPVPIPTLTLPRKELLNEPSHSSLFKQNNVIDSNYVNEEHQKDNNSCNSNNILFGVSQWLTGRVLTENELRELFRRANVTICVSRLTECDPCDYCVLFTSEFSIAHYLVPIARCLTAIRLVSSKASHTNTKEVCTCTSNYTNSLQIVQGSEAANIISNNERCTHSLPELTTSQTSQMYPSCFTIVAVPVNAHQISLHITLKTEIQDVFYQAMIDRFNNVYVAAADLPFPSSVHQLTEAQRKRILFCALEDCIYHKVNVPAHAQIEIFPTHTHAARNALWSSSFQVCHLFSGPAEDNVAHYFGNEVMFYFAWMHHYIKWLIGLSLMRVLISCFAHITVQNFTFGVFSFFSDNNSNNNNNIIHRIFNSHLPLRNNDNYYTNYYCEERRQQHQQPQYGVDNNNNSSNLLQSNSWMFVHVVLMLLGSVACVKTWEREYHRLMMRHELRQQEACGDRQRGFHGDWQTDSITKERVPHYAYWERALLRQPFSWLLILLALCFTFAVMLVSLNLEGLTNEVDWGNIPWLYQLSHNNDALLNASAHPWRIWCVSFVYGVFINVLSSGFAYLAKELTKWENYQYHGDYIRALTLKRVVFDFCNSYCKLFYVAFIRRDASLLAASLRSLFLTNALIQLLNDTVIPFIFTHRRQILLHLWMKYKCVSTFTELPKRYETYSHKPSEPSSSTCLPKEKECIAATDDGGNNVSSETSQIELPSISLTVKAKLKITEIVDDVMKAFMTWFIGNAQLECNKTNLTNNSNTSQWITNEFDENLEVYDLYSDCIQTAIQFGYLIFFTSIFPSASVVALCANLIEVRSDLLKLCYVARRPVPRLGVEEWATWCDILKVFVFVSAITNTLLLCFTTGQLASWMPSHFYRTLPDKSKDTPMRLHLVKENASETIWCVVLLEHALILIVLFLFWRVSSTPREVKEKTARRMLERVQKCKSLTECLAWD